MALEVARRLINNIWTTDVADDGAGGGGSSAFTDRLAVQASNSGVTFGGTTNKVFAPGDLTVTATLGTDIALVDDGFGQAAFQTTGGGTFIISVALDMTLTQDAGSAAQRVLTFAQSGYDPQRVGQISCPLLMLDGFEMVVTASGALLVGLPAGTIFGAAPAFIPDLGVSADSYHVYYDCAVTRLSPLT